MTQRTIFDDTVASRIEALLAKCDRIRRGVDIDRPHMFDTAGEKHANHVAQRDQENNRG